uniref:DUF4371 domain-containing protein n=1 Tax=Latimeria chalumnae TaxID=7897 RepID=H2ZW76_LATCH
RKFQEKWTDEFFFVLNEISMKPVCLICQKTRSAFKRSNLERHHTTVHAGFKCLAEASFEIWILARHKKAFTDAEIIKECFLASTEILYADFNNKNTILKQIKGLQQSDTTVMRRVEEIGKDIRQQLMADLSAAPCFSLALDESTDISDFSQLCVWIRFPKKELFCEELLCLIPMKTQTKGEDIFTALLNFFTENNLEWKKLVSLVPNMRGKEKGLLGLMRKQEGIPKFIMFHCIIHQEALQNSALEKKNLLDKREQSVLFIIS